MAGEHPSFRFDAYPAHETDFARCSVPAIEDPTTGVTLWESGAIIEYLIDQYDTSNKLSFKSSPEKYQTLQWLHFQMSGQGPYFGQGAWYSTL